RLYQLRRRDGWKETSVSKLVQDDPGTLREPIGEQALLFSKPIFVPRVRDSAAMPAPPRRFSNDCNVELACAFHPALLRGSGSERAISEELFLNQVCHRYHEVRICPQFAKQVEGLVPPADY